MEFIETSIFTRQVQAVLTDDEYSELQVALAVHPTMGAIIPQSGGLRKIRWSMNGRGKRAVCVQFIIGLWRRIKFSCCLYTRRALKII